MCKVYLQRRDRLNMIKYNIYGFSQSMLIKYGLDVIDALLLRYFVDFKNSGKMIKEKFHGEDYYWIDYKSVIEYIPIINITTNNALRRRLRRSEEHTSELQSRQYLVCRLLLEKKKQHPLFY